MHGAGDAEECCSIFSSKNMSIYFSIYMYMSSESPCILFHSNWLKQPYIITKLFGLKVDSKFHLVCRALRTVAIWKINWRTMDEEKCEILLRNRTKWSGIQKNISRNVWFLLNIQGIRKMTIVERLCRVCSTSPRVFDSRKEPYGSVGLSEWISLKGTNFHGGFQWKNRFFGYHFWDTLYIEVLEKKAQLRRLKT